MSEATCWNCRGTLDDVTRLCPKHAAASDLLAACKYALQFVREYDPDLKLHPSLREKLTSSISKAEAKP
jgi:hypothetical protein